MDVIPAQVGQHLRTLRFKKPRSGESWDEFAPSALRAVESHLDKLADSPLTVSEIPIGRAIKKEFLKLTVARRLRVHVRKDGLANDMLNEAEQILNKSNSTSRAPAHLKRTRSEESFVNCARVAWHNLLRKGGIRTHDRRSGAGERRAKSRRATDPLAPSGNPPREILGHDTLTRLQSVVQDLQVIRQEIAKRHVQRLDGIAVRLGSLVDDMRLEREPLSSRSESSEITRQELPAERERA